MMAGLSPRSAARESTSSVSVTSGISTSGYSLRMMREAALVDRSATIRPPPGEGSQYAGAVKAAHRMPACAGQVLVGDDAVHSGEDRQHDLVHPAADRQQATVAEEAARPGLVHVADAAVELETRVGHFSDQATSRELGDRREPRRVLAGDVRLGRGVVVLTQQVDFRRQLGQVVLHPLVLDQRLAERPPLAGVLDPAPPRTSALAAS